MNNLDGLWPKYPASETRTDRVLGAIGDGIYVVKHSPYTLLIVLGALAITVWIYVM